MQRFSALKANVLALVVTGLLTSQVSAQSHFQDCISMTGSSANVVVPASAFPEINGNELAVGDEIALYTTDGTCAGTGEWTGNNLSISIWGDDAVTVEKDGFTNGEAIAYRVYDMSADTVAVDVEVVYDTSQPFYRGVGTYADNALFALSSLVAAYDTESVIPQVPVLTEPAEGEMDVPLSTTIRWAAVANAETYHLQISEDPTLLTMWAEVTNLEEPEYELVDLPSGTRMYWRVAAANVSGAGEFSDVRTFTTLGGAAVNTVPFFASSPLLQVAAGTLYEYEVAVEDPDEDEVTLAVVALPPWLSLDAQNNRLFGTPSVGDIGAYDITLQIEDEHGAQADQTFTLVVKSASATNTPPAIKSPIADQALSLASSSHTISLSSHVEDADLDPLGFSARASETGIVEVRINGDALTLTPRRRGTVDVEVEVVDGFGGGVLLSFAVVVAGNRSPTARTESRTLMEDTPMEIAVLANDVDPDGDPLTISIVTQPAHGAASVSGDRVRYVPSEDYWGQDSFVYRVSDDFGGSASAVVYLEVTAENDPPRFSAADAILAPEDGAEILLTPASVSANESFELSWTLASDPEEDGVTHFWQYASVPDFSTFLGSIELPSSGSVVFTHRTIDSLLTAAYLPAEGDVVLYHRIRARDGRSTSVSATRSLIFARAAGTSAGGHELPLAFDLGQNYPNPFNPSTTIDYTVDHTGEATLLLFNVLGQRVAVLAGGVHEAGSHSVELDGSTLPSGLYLYRLVSNGRALTRTAVLHK